MTKPKCVKLCTNSLYIYVPWKKRFFEICWRTLSHTLAVPYPPCYSYNSDSMRMTLPHLLSAKSLPSISPWVTSSFLLSILTSATTYFLPLYFISKCSSSLFVSQWLTSLPVLFNLVHARSCVAAWACNHSGAIANSRGKCWGFAKCLTCSQNWRRRASGQQACFICNNGFLLTKYLLAEGVDVCIYVWKKCTHVKRERP